MWSSRAQGSGSLSWTRFDLMTQTGTGMIWPPRTGQASCSNECGGAACDQPLRGSGQKTGPRYVKPPNQQRQREQADERSDPQSF